MVGGGDGVGGRDSGRVSCFGAVLWRRRCLGLGGGGVSSFRYCVDELGEASSSELVYSQPRTSLFLVLNCEFRYFCGAESISPRWAVEGRAAGGLDMPLSCCETERQEGVPLPMDVGLKMR